LPLSPALDAALPEFGNGVAGVWPSATVVPAGGAGGASDSAGVLVVTGRMTVRSSSGIGLLMTRWEEDLEGPTAELRRIGVTDCDAESSTIQAVKPVAHAFGPAS
jgi:hypothetical protein